MRGPAHVLRLDVLRTIIERALRHHPHPFAQSGTCFTWEGSARLVSKQTNRHYDVTVFIRFETSPRLAAQVAACVCKPEVRFADLQVVALVDTRLRGSIEVTGLPRGDEKQDLLKFLKQVESVAGKTVP